MRRPPRAFRCLLLTAMVTAAALSPRAARSQSAEDKTAAEALYEEGKKLLGSKRFPEACARFEASQKLDPGVGTLLFLADCYESMGRTASAWSTFREAASAAKAAGQADRERVARERAGKLDGKLYQLTISAPAAAQVPGLQIIRNDSPIKKEVWNVAVPVDPGSYKLTASAPGKVTWTTTIEVPSGTGGRTVEIPALADDPTAAPTAISTPTAAPTASNTASVGPAASSAPTASATGTVESPPPGMSAGRTAGVVIGVAGLVGVGVGAALGGVALSNFSQVKTACPNVACGDQAAVDLSKQTGVLADVSTVAFVAGGVLAAGGLVLFLVSGSSAPSSPPARAAWISPMAGNGVAGLRAGSVW